MPLKDKNLLLLEDNIEFTQNAISLFEIFVKKTYTAVDIKEAKDTLENKSIDIIICDIKLKNENGLDFIKKVRKKNDKIPIVVLSGHKDEELLFRAMTLNLSGYLLKPINYEKLQETFQRCEEKLKQNGQNKIELKDGYIYNKNLKEIIKDGKIYELNKKEILFIEMLCEYKDQIITRDMILEHVYEYNSMSYSAVNNFILRIRKRFGNNFIFTISDVGYKFII